MKPSTISNDLKLSADLLFFQYKMNINTITIFYITKQFQYNIKKSNIYISS